VLRGLPYRPQFDGQRHALRGGFQRPSDGDRQLGFQDAVYGARGGPIKRRDWRHWQ
jgi:hypothetical protein